MKTYNYNEDVKADVKEYIQDNYINSNYRYTKKNSG